MPQADGNWGACDPSDAQSSFALFAGAATRGGADEGETTVIVDTAPDFRLQTAAAGIERVDAVLYTHDHADQTHGIDDLRVFAGRMRRRVPCWMDPGDHAALTRRFAINGAAMRLSCDMRCAGYARAWC